MHRGGMHRGLRRAVAVLLLGSGVVACGTDGDIIPVATPAAQFDDLSVDWRPEPFAVAPDVAAAAEQFCRSNPAPAIPARFPLGIVDARGGGRLILLFTGAGRGFGECQLRTAGRRFRGDGGGVQQVDDPASIEPDEIQLFGGGGASGDLPGDDYTYMMGQAGEAVRSVVVTLDGGQQVHASLRDGWWVAWWPFRSTRERIVGYDQNGIAIAEVVQ
jgi:hypothetical protein